MSEQIDLLPCAENEHLHRYWRSQLLGWPREVFENRHARNCTGWSMARQGLIFAECLLLEGQLTRGEFRRWFRFHCRIQRWHKKY